MKSLYTRSTLRYFTKTFIWPLLVYLQLTISYKKALFHFHYKNVELYVVTQRLNGLLLYWKHLHDGLALESQHIQTNTTYLLTTKQAQLLQKIQNMTYLSFSNNSELYIIFHFNKEFSFDYNSKSIFSFP